MSGTLGVIGQTLSSTYSDNGIGLLNYQGLPNNMAMGEVGIATPTSWSMNFQNPAFLPFNRLSVFQVGIEMDRRTMNGDGLEDSKVEGGLRYLNYAFPVLERKWTTSFGLSPYSSVSLNKFSSNTVNETETITELISNGGLSVFHWANGFQLTKTLYAGVRSSLIFGSVNYSQPTYFDNSGGFTETYTDDRTYSGAQYDISLGYLQELNDDSRLNFGLVYKLENDLTGSRNVSNKTQLSENVIIEDEAILYIIPSSVAIGVSYQLINKLTLATDITMSSWSNGGSENDSFTNTTKIGIGGEWTPDYSSVNNYWKRVSYRLGINFDKLPYRVSNQEVREVGVSFGGSFPVAASSLDVAFKYGTLGALDNDLIKETYFRIVIGATMNDKWFRKRKYD